MKDAHQKVTQQNRKPALVQIKANKQWRNSIIKSTQTDPVAEMVASSMPHSRPQAAPISSDGMKTPADTARP